MKKIEAVPRAEAERMFPKLAGQPLWGEQESYDMSECKALNYIVYGPISVKALSEAQRIFKSVKIVNKGEKNEV